jgi:hypothetical protein
MISATSTLKAQSSILTQTQQSERSLSGFIRRWCCREGPGIRSSVVYDFIGSDLVGKHADRRRLESDLAVRTLLDLLIVFLETALKRCSALDDIFHIWDDDLLLCRA